MKYFTLVSKKTNNIRLIMAIMILALALSTPSQASLMAPGASSNSATLSWTAPGDDGNQGIATTYDIRYSTSVITDANWDQASQVNDEPAPQVAGSAESYTVQNLDPNTSYYFAIMVADEIPNWSSLSNVVNVTTSYETDAPSIIADLSSTSQTVSTIELSWTAPGDDGIIGTAATYDLRYSTSPITSANWDAATLVVNEPAPSVAGTVETMTITGLSENTTYYFAIKTGDEVPNWSALSNVLSVTTTVDQTPPASINDLEVSAGTVNGQLKVSWTAPGDDGPVGKAATYLLRYSTEMINEFNWLAPVTDSSNFVVNPLTPSESGVVENYTINNLAPGAAYYVAVKAIDENGNTSFLSNVGFGTAYFDLSLDADDDQFASLPDEYQLAQNYPNPFNPSTEIAFSLPENSYVSLDIYNSLGQKVKSLANEQFPVGVHTLAWNGTDQNGQMVSSGVYFYRLSTENFSQSKKMVMLK